MDQSQPALDRLQPRLIELHLAGVSRRDRASSSTVMSARSRLGEGAELRIEPC